MNKVIQNLIEQIVDLEIKNKEFVNYKFIAESKLYTYENEILKLNKEIEELKASENIISNQSYKPIDGGSTCITLND